MPNVPSVDADTLKATLLSRGMLADRGRYTPFASVDAGDASSAAPTGVGSTAQQNGTVAAGGGADTAPSAATTPDPNNPNAAGSNALPVSDQALDGMSEDDALKLLGALGIAGAAALAYIYRRRTRLNPAGGLDEPVPTVEGTVIEPSDKAIKGSDIVDGEYTTVEPAQIGTTKKIAQGAEVPDNQGMKALGAPKQVQIPAPKPKGMKRTTLAQSMKDRATRTEPNDLGPIPMRDQMSDLSYEEKMQANYLATEMQRQRKAGNRINIRRLTGQRTNRTMQPTGNTEYMSLLNQAIRMIRQGKLKPATIARIP